MTSTLDESDDRNGEQREENDEEGESEQMRLSARQSLTNQLNRNSFLEDELERLLDDIDAYEAKIDDAEEEIEQLLFEKKKLQLKLDNVGFRRNEIQLLQKELDDARSRIVNQQIILDEQEQIIEEQDYIIAGYEADFQKIGAGTTFTGVDDDNGETRGATAKQEKNQEREQRTSKIRKSQLQISSVKKAMEGAALQLDFDFDDDDAQDKIQMLEKQKEDNTTRIAMLEDCVKELQEKAKEAEQVNESLVAKVSKSSEQCHEWKRRAEVAEQRLVKSMGVGLSDIDEENEDLYSDNNNDAQGLLLQSAVSRNKEKKNNNSSWGFLFGQKKSSRRPQPIINKQTSVGFFDNDGAGRASSMMSVTSSISTNQSGDPDDSDFSAMQQVNKTLKENNKELRQNLEQIEKAHKREQSFNQKLIVKLQKENDKLSKKFGVKSVNERLSPGGTSSSATTKSSTKSSKRKSRLSTIITSKPPIRQASRQSVGLQGIQLNYGRLSDRSSGENVGAVLDSPQLESKKPSSSLSPPNRERTGSASSSSRQRRPSNTPPSPKRSLSPHRPSASTDKRSLSPHRTSTRDGKVGWGKPILH